MFSDKTKLHVMVAHLILFLPFCCQPELKNQTSELDFLYLPQNEMIHNFERMHHFHIHCLNYIGSLELSLMLSRKVVE